MCLLVCCRCSACDTFLLFIGFYSVSITLSPLLFYGGFGCAEACPVLSFLAASPTCLFLHLSTYTPKYLLFPSLPPLLILSSPPPLFTISPTHRVFSCLSLSRLFYYHAFFPIFSLVRVCVCLFSSPYSCPHSFLSLFISDGPHRQTQVWAVVHA